MMLKKYIQEKVALIVDETQEEADTLKSIGPAVLWRAGEKWAEQPGLELAIIAVAPELRHAVAAELCRRRMDFAVLGLPWTDEEQRSSLIRRYKKAHLHSALLGTFRYCWPVCALRELTVTGCMGTIYEADWKVCKPERDDWRVRDAVKWLEIEPDKVRVEAGECCALKLLAEKGTAQLYFKSDGWGKISVVAENIRKKLDREEIMQPSLLMEISVIQNSRKEKYGWAGLDSLQDTRQVNG